MNQVNPKNSIMYKYGKSELDRLRDILKGKTLIFMFFPGIRKCFHKDQLISKKYQLYESRDYLFTSYMMGTSNAITKLQELLYLGINNVIHIGLAASISKFITPFSVVIPESGYSDSSVPYLISNKNIFINNRDWFIKQSFNFSKDYLWSDLIDNKLQTMNPFYSQNIFSTDLLYFETSSKLQILRDNNINLIDMESCSINALCQFYNISCNGIYMISDIISKNNWHQCWKDKKLFNMYEKLINFFI